MKYWLLFKHRLSCICLTLLGASLSAGAMTLRHHEDSFPAPCDQLERLSHRELCARFLADREAVGCQTFSNITTVANQGQLKDGLGQAESSDGLILLVTRNFEIKDQTTSMVTRGTVAIIGDPDLPPEISFIEHIFDAAGAFAVIFAHSTESRKALFCWGIEWIQDSPVAIFYVAGQFGMHILHSIFRTNWRPQTLTRYRHNYLYFSPTLVSEGGKPGLLIAHNQFYGAPVARLAESLLNQDILIKCLPVGSTANCQKAGEAVIRDNTWHGHSRYSRDNNYVAVQITNIPEVIFSGNQAADNNAVLSVNMVFDHELPADGSPFFENLNLQLVNNRALPGVNASHRQFYLDGIRSDTDYPLAGVVNITCDPYFDVRLTGSFANTDDHGLAIIMGNNYCTRLPRGDFAENPGCEAPTLNDVTDVVNQNRSDGNTGDSDSHEDGNGVLFISTYALGVSTVVMAVVSWELFWSLAYHHTGGKAQKVVNALALFIPGCARRLVELSADTN